MSEKGSGGEAEGAPRDAGGGQLAGAANLRRTCLRAGVASPIDIGVAGIGASARYFQLKGVVGAEHT